MKEKVYFKNGYKVYEYPVYIVETYPSEELNWAAEGIPFKSKPWQIDLSKEDYQILKSFGYETKEYDRVQMFTVPEAHGPQRIHTIQHIHKVYVDSVVVDSVALENVLAVLFKDMEEKLNEPVSTIGVRISRPNQTDSFIPYDGSTNFDIWVKIIKKKMPEDSKVYIVKGEMEEVK